MTIEKIEVMGSDGKIYERTKCQVWTRVMGYLRPVQNFNIGKRQEYKDRVWFQENKIDNSPFLKRWASAKSLES